MAPLELPAEDGNAPPAWSCFLADFISQQSAHPYHRAERTRAFGEPTGVIVSSLVTPQVGRPQPHHDDQAWSRIPTCGVEAEEVLWSLYASPATDRRPPDATLRMHAHRLWLRQGVWLRTHVPLEHGDGCRLPRCGCGRGAAIGPRRPPAAASRPSTLL